MDKIPSALQHKIDYINALDIPNLNKYKRIAAAMANYWADNCNGDVNISANGGKGLWNRDEYNAQRVNQVRITGINPEGMFTAESIAEAIKEIRSIGVQPSTPWPQIQTPSDTLKYAPYESPNDKPAGPINTKFKGEQPSGWYLAGCFLCVSILSASLGAILERTL
jgi:hypothetical protein